MLTQDALLVPPEKRRFYFMMHLVICVSEDLMVNECAVSRRGQAEQSESFSVR